ncbi:hypothetical protein [Pseudomonas sp. LP_7_YM]|uniref:hypothetical protein n=1 Tax=Pseudomonas sp. LP_7_YM TaxID=2485137 RepID=UPI00105C4D7E|nr:hypothetical protein [Pseudomonas sp. LP_7_YM]TDV67504.1 hypothetical protein EC915_10333 [Pseudomonas sp. LP_7_YM]
MTTIPIGLLAALICLPMIFFDLWLIYAIHVYTEKAESMMPTSSFVQANRQAYSQAGLIGKAIRNGFLTGVLLMPNLSNKRGIVNLSEVRSFPAGLKHLLFITWGLCAFFFTALMALGLYMKYIEI